MGLFFVCLISQAHIDATIGPESCQSHSPEDTPLLFCSVQQHLSDSFSLALSARMSAHIFNDKQTSSKATATPTDHEWTVC